MREERGAPCRDLVEHPADIELRDAAAAPAAHLRPRCDDHGWAVELSRQPSRNQADDSGQKRRVIHHDQRYRFVSQQLSCPVGRLHRRLLPFPVPPLQLLGKGGRLLLRLRHEQLPSTHGGVHSSHGVQPWGQRPADVLCVHVAIRQPRGAGRRARRPTLGVHRISVPGRAARWSGSRSPAGPHQRWCPGRQETRGPVGIPPDRRTGRAPGPL